MMRRTDVMIGCIPGQAGVFNYSQRAVQMRAVPAYLVCGLALIDRLPMLLLAHELASHAESLPAVAHKSLPKALAGALWIVLHSNFGPGRGSSQLS